MLQKNPAAVLGALAEEAEIRKCPTAKGLYTFCGTFRFVASVYLQADVLPHLARLSKVFQKAHVNFLHIKQQVTVPDRVNLLYIFCLHVGLLYQIHF